MLATHLAVISPNVLELQSLLSIEPGTETTLEDVTKAAQTLHDLVSAQTSQVPAIIVRAGHLGSYTLSPQWTGWITPYFTSSNQSRVIDPTGGGTGFLGGLCAGLSFSDGDMREGESDDWSRLMSRITVCCYGSQFCNRAKRASEVDYGRRR